MSFRYRASVVALVALVLFASTAFSSTAFTSADVDREATVAVAADDAALLALTDGHPGDGLVEQTGAGTLEIDFGLGGGTGANEDAVFDFGSTSTPTSNHAFRIANRGTGARSLDLAFALSGSDGGDPAANVEFTFYLDTGTDGTIDSTLSTSEEDAGVTFSSVAPGDTVYAVVTVDTRDLGASSADLSGELSVSAGN